MIIQIRNEIDGNSNIKRLNTPENYATSEQLPVYIVIVMCH